MSEYEKAGIPVFKPYVGMKDMDLKSGAGFKIRAFHNKDKDGKWLHGNSDGTECPCYGFYIQHPDMGSLVYVTDTEYVRWRFKNVNHILVEANYSSTFLCDGDSESVKRNHVLTGHMEIDTTCKFLEVNKSAALRNVVLLHLSSNNADSDDFKSRAQTVVDCSVYIADKGLELELGLPF